MRRLQVKKEDIVLSNRGVEIRLSSDYSKLEAESMARLSELVRPYPKTSRFIEVLVADPEVRANWDSADYLVVAKLNFNDHGEVHHKVVATAAASILHLLVESGVQPDVVTSGAGDVDDAFLVTVVAALLHDIGNQVHREGHPAMSVVLAIPILDRLLAPLYPDVEQRCELRGFILHAIRTHDIDLAPLTLEASIVAVADACDMTKGRARYVFDVGEISIHTVGALAIERVQIGQGKNRPVAVSVELSNSAGIFPVEHYLLPKVNVGALASYVEVLVSSSPEDSHSDQRIVYTVEMKGKKFVAVGPDATQQS
jgi:metal-dependent HD superfamily phosphatase/phosphodiesterase